MFQPTEGALFPTARVVAGIAIGDGFGWFLGGTFKIEGLIGYDSMGYFSQTEEDAFSIGATNGPRVHPLFITGFRL
jgi:hypothetical protein